MRFPEFTVKLEAIFSPSTDMCKAGLLMEYLDANRDIACKATMVSCLKYNVRKANINFVLLEL